MTSRTYEGSDASEEAVVCAALKVDVRSAVKMRIKDRMIKSSSMLQRTENPDRWLHLGNCMKITKLQHELHGIQVVDSGAVRPHSHHLNFDQLSAVGYNARGCTKSRRWLLPTNQ